MNCSDDVRDSQSRERMLACSGLSPVSLHCRLSSGGCCVCELKIGHIKLPDVGKNSGRPLLRMGVNSLWSQTNPRRLLKFWIAVVFVLTLEQIAATLFLPRGFSPTVITDSVAWLLMLSATMVFSTTQFGPRGDSACFGYSSHLLENATAGADGLDVFRGGAAEGSPQPVCRRCSSVPLKYSHPGSAAV
jgi:hypothetical protein